MQSHQRINWIIDDATSRLAHKLSSLTQNIPGISNYTRNYLSSLLGDIDNTVSRYNYILKNLMLTQTLRDDDTLNILDYGGGTGMLSLLACESGFKNVYYNDIYDVSCRDAALIAEALGILRKDYILGDLADVISYCTSHNLVFDAIGSYDVIEHIYDITYFLSNIGRTMSDCSCMFMCSGANPYNDSTYRQLVEAHFKCEYFNREATFGCKERDSLAAYSKIRREMISIYASTEGLQLTEEELDTLTCCTRGMMRHDIAKAVNNFAFHHIYPKPDMKYPTNTCDPHTGNWAEHLMDFDKLLNVLKQSGFTWCQIVPDQNALPQSTYISLFALKQPERFLSWPSAATQS